MKAWREGLECLDRLEDEVEEDDRRQQRQRDAEELAQRAGAVHRRGLVEVLRDLPQAGEEDDHRRAELPDREHDQRPQRVVGMRDPARARWTPSVSAEKLVDQAVGAENLPPQDRDRDRRAEQRRQVEGGAIEADAAHAAVERHGKRQRDGELQRHRPDHVVERDRQRVAEPPVLEEGVFVVLQPRPARRGQEVVVGEGEIERGERRAERQAEEADQPGREEQIARARCAARRGPAARRAGGRRSAAPARMRMSPIAVVAMAIRRRQARSSTALAFS